jgi:5-formyltetrahydrofolate cyclo-ligase
VSDFDIIRAQKRVLRREMVARILAMDPRERSRQEDALAERLGSLPGFTKAQSVMLYVTAFPEEIDTTPLLRLVLELGKRLVCPRVDSTAHRLRLYQIEDLASDFTPGVLGIREPCPGRPELMPDQIDWLLVPGLAFDERGFRLGRGGGYYDRFLPTLSRATVRWALAFEPQYVDSLPIEPHDQRLDGVATPSRILHTPRENPAIF